MPFLCWLPEHSDTNLWPTSNQEMRTQQVLLDFVRQSQCQGCVCVCVFHKHTCHSSYLRGKTLERTNVLTSGFTALRSFLLSAAEMAMLQNLSEAVMLLLGKFSLSPCCSRHGETVGCSNCECGSCLGQASSCRTLL